MTSTWRPVCPKALADSCCNMWGARKRVRCPLWQRLGFSHPCRWGSRLLLQLAKSLGACRALRLIKKKKPVRWTALAAAGQLLLLGPGVAHAERAGETVSRAQREAWVMRCGWPGWWSRHTGGGSVRDQAGDRNLRRPQTWTQSENLDSEEGFCPGRKFENQSQDFSP